MVVFLCELHAVTANCERTVGDNITLTFLFRTMIVLRNGHTLYMRHFVLGFMEGKAFGALFMDRYERK